MRFQAVAPSRGGLPRRSHSKRCWRRARPVPGRSWSDSSGVLYRPAGCGWRGRSPPGAVRGGTSAVLQSAPLLTETLQVRFLPLELGAKVVAPTGVAAGPMGFSHPGRRPWEGAVPNFVAAATSGRQTGMIPKLLLGSSPLRVLVAEPTQPSKQGVTGAAPVGRTMRRSSAAQARLVGVMNLATRPRPAGGGRRDRGSIPTRQRTRLERRPKGGGRGSSPAVSVSRSRPRRAPGLRSRAGRFNSYREHEAGAAPAQPG